MEPFTTDSVNYSGVQIKKNNSPYESHITYHHILLITSHISPYMTCKDDLHI